MWVCGWVNVFLCVCVCVGGWAEGFTCVRVCACARQVCAHVVKLSLCWNHIGDVGAVAIENALRFGRAGRTVNHYFHSLPILLCYPRSCEFEFEGVTVYMRVPCISE
jgi:hypothetical protein